MLLFFIFKCMHIHRPDSTESFSVIKPGFNPLIQHSSLNRGQLTYDSKLFITEKQQKMYCIFASALQCKQNCISTAFYCEVQISFLTHPSPLYFSPFQLSVRSTVHHHDWVCWGCRCQREQQETRHHRVYQPDKQLLPHQPKVRLQPEAKLMF